MKEFAVCLIHHADPLSTEGSMFLLHWVRIEIPDSLHSLASSFRLVTGKCSSLFQELNQRHVAGYSEEDDIFLKSWFYKF